MEDTPLWSFAIDKLNRAIYYIVHKGQKGARKGTHNKADITSTSTALYLIDTLVKHRQANPYTRTPKIRQYRFSLASGSALGKAFFLYTREVFASK